MNGVFEDLTGRRFGRLVVVKERLMTKMSRTEAVKKAQKRYQGTLKGFNIKLKPEQLERYQQAAQAKGMTFRAFVLSSMGKAMAE